MREAPAATGQKTGVGDPAAAPAPPPPGWTERLRAFGYTPPRTADTASRLVPPFPEPRTAVWRFFGVAPAAAARLARAMAWAGPLLVALFAGVLRFVHLGRPHAVIFDETYYAKDAWSLLHHGHETSWPDDANERILAGDVPLGDAASYVVHPPVGKWTIALGEWAFGMNPFGWRFAVALLGTVSVLMLCRIGRRLFRSTLLGCLAGLLMALDGLHFVMSRTALLDLVLMFWVLAAFGCLLVDRDRARARLAAALARARPAGASGGPLRPAAGVGGGLGLGVRPWRLAAGVCLGLACATKWSGLYVLAAFGILTVLWDAASRRTAGAPFPYRAMLRRDAGPAFLSLVPVAVVTYVASWSGWFAGSGGYYRQWGAEHSPTGNGAWDALRSLLHYHGQAYEFHVGLNDEHPYQSNPFGWLAAVRPVLFFYRSDDPGEGGCELAGGCARSVLGLGTPVLWWAACAAVAYLLYRWGLRRDWRAGAVLCGLAAGYLPWFMYQDRTIFYFYAVLLVPFLCLAVAMLAGALLGPPGCTERRRVTGIAVVGALVLVIACNFIYFYPIYTGQELPMDGWRARMWLSSWI